MTTPKGNTLPNVVDLKEKDLVTVVHNGSYPTPRVEVLEVISLENWEKLGKLKARKDNIRWLIIGSDMFLVINSTKLFEKPRQALANKYNLDITLLEIERHKEEWYIITVLNSVISWIQKLTSGHKV